LRLLALAAATGIAVSAAPIGHPAEAEPATDSEPTPIVEDYAYPGAAEIERTEGIRLLRGDGRILLAKCDAGNADLIKVESIARGDFCFAVKGTAGRLDLWVQGVFLVGAGARNVAVTVEGLETPIEVPSGAARPVLAADPAKAGVVVGLRASGG